MRRRQMPASTPAVSGFAQVPVSWPTPPPGPATIFTSSVTRPRHFPSIAVISRVIVATSPAATGASRLDTDSAASQAYLAYLEGLHADLGQRHPGKVGRAVEVAYRYDAVFNGIAVRLNPTEAQQISTLAGIRSVTRDYSRELQTDNGPKWIGADAIWGEEPVTGNAACVGNCGEGVVAGIIDTGVNVNHPSFR